MPTEHGDRIAFMPDFVNVLLPTSERITKVYTKGLHSDAIILSDRVAVKVLEGGKRREHTAPAKALELGRLIYGYFTRMRTLSPGLVPEFLHCAVIPSRSDEASDASLVIVAPYEGTDFEDALKRNEIEPSAALNLLLNAINPVLVSADVNGRTKVGLDPKPANFCVRRRNGKADGAVFIDFVPPRYRQEDGVYLVDYPHPKDPDAYAHVFWKYYTAEGILSNLLAQFCRTTPGTWGVYCDFLLDWLEMTGKRNLQNWLGKLNDSLLTPEALTTECNPLVLRLCACKLASQNDDLKERLVEFFTNISRYEDGPLDRVCSSARTYLLQFTARSGMIQVAGMQGTATGKDTMMARCVTFLNSHQTIDLSSFRAFGDYVRWDSETRSRLIKLKDQVSRIMNNDVPRERPTNFLICGPSSAGKTFMIKELAGQFPDVHFSLCRLSDYKNAENATAEHLGDIVTHHKAKKLLIACLDEADTRVSGEHIYKKLLGPMAGDPFPHPRKARKECCLKNVVWFFIASSAETADEFMGKLQCIDDSEKPMDFWNRFQSDCRIDVPFDPHCPEERIIITASAVMQKARKRGMTIQHIDSKVLMCLGMRTDSTPRDIEKLIEESVESMEAGSTIFRLEQLRLADQEKMASLEHLSRHQDRGTEWLIEIEP